MDGIHDPIEITIKKYSSHPSVKPISSNTNSSHTFAFSSVTTHRVSAKLRRFKVKKASHIDSIPGRIFKDDLGIFTDILHQHFNASIDDEIFLQNLKKVR